MIVKPTLGGRGVITDVTTESVTNPVLQLPPPTGANAPVKNDLLLAFIYARSTSFPITAQGSGWTKEEAIGSIGCRFELWWRYATASEPSTHNFLMTGTPDSNNAGFQGYIQRVQLAHLKNDPIGFWAENTGQDGNLGWTVNGGSTPEELWIRGFMYCFSDLNPFGFPAGLDISEFNPEGQGAWGVDWDSIFDYYTTTVPSTVVISGEVDIGSNDYWAAGHFTIRPRPDDANQIMFGCNF